MPLTWCVNVNALLRGIDELHVRLQRRAGREERSDGARRPATAGLGLERSIVRLLLVVPAIAAARVTTEYHQ